MHCNICGYDFGYGEEYALDDWDRPCHPECLDSLEPEDYDCDG